MLKGNLVILASVALVLSMFLLGVSDSKASVADAGAPDAEVSNTQVASNETQEEEPPDSSSATITITMHT
jgi:hypothetical protein